MWRTILFSVMALLMLLPNVLLAEEKQETAGLFFEPSFTISTFTTDKGEWRQEIDAIGQSRTLDVHTGGFNWVLTPGFGAGWNWGPWYASMQANYPVQFADFNLPHDETAEGIIQSLEIGPQIAYRMMDLGWTTVEIQGGLALRALAIAKLQQNYNDRIGSDEYRTFNGQPGWSGFAVTLGAGGDLMRGEHVLLGWIWRFYWGRFNLHREEDNYASIEEIGDGDDLWRQVDVYDEEDLTLNVYSAWLGVRLRIFPSTKDSRQ